LKKSVTNSNIIKGIIKEALFLDLEVELLLNEFPMRCQIVEVNDGENCSFLLYTENGVTSAQPDDENLEVSIFFKNFRVNFQSLVDFSRTPFFMLKMPSEIHLINQRQELRHKVDLSNVDWARVSIRNPHQVAPGYFKLSNISKNGFGGELISENGFILSTQSTFSGKYWFENTWLELEGNIKSIRDVSTLPDQRRFCLVGLEFARKPSIQKLHPPIASSRARRQNCDFTLDFYPLLQKTKPIKLAIKNVSISGFLCQIPEEESQAIILSSRRLMQKNSSMIVELVSYEDSQFRFQWVEGNESDRLNWLKEISQFLGVNYDTRNFRLDDILSLFCQSGSLSSQFIKEQKKMSQKMLQTLAQGGDSEPWIYRLTNRNSDGKAVGYAAAMKSGENAWSAVDLVSDRYDEKLNKEFIPIFLQSLKEFCLHKIPCSKIFIGWVHQHPYFKKYMEYLSELKSPHVLGQCHMFYTRLSKEIFEMPAQGQIIHQQIQAADFESITKIGEKLKKQGLSEFADVMDFNVNTFSSPGLGELFKKSTLPFRREYFYTQISTLNGQLDFLTIMTLVPEGNNPGRWIDSLYLFELGSTSLPNQEWSDLKKSLITLANARGFSTHAIRRLSPSSHLYQNEITHLTGLVLHPLALDYWNKKS
jgi:hypothetical protein